jgi:hypothetical protein
MTLARRGSTKYFDFLAEEIKQHQKFIQTWTTSYNTSLQSWYTPKWTLIHSPIIDTPSTTEKKNRPTTVRDLIQKHKDLGKAIPPIVLECQKSSGYTWECSSCLIILKASLKNTPPTQSRSNVSKDTEELLPTMNNLLRPKTQKAKGIKAVYKNRKRIFSVKDKPPTITALREHLGSIPIFARPCPILPRHGFVDSRVVANTQEIKDLFKETYEADPEAEIVFSEYYDCIASATLTPNLLSIGKGNAGSTEGVDSISIPVSPIISKNDFFSVEAGITSAPYYEAIFTKDFLRGADYSTNLEAVKLVQLRDGPKTEKNTVTDRWVPRTITVNNIVKAEGDLLKWEAWCKENKDTNDTAVYHPGGNLISHYAAHCKLNRIPILIDKEPKLGRELQKTVAKIGEFNRTQFFQGLNSSFEHDLETYEERNLAIYFILFCCHHSTELTGKNTYLLGKAIGFLLRLGAMACFGESRHTKATSLSRLDCYNGVSKASKNLRFFEKLPLALESFKYLPWGNSFGGKAWARCTKSLITLYDKVKNETDISSIIGALNQAVHEAHNGGWWLNKFAASSTADLFAEKHKITHLIGGFAIYYFLNKNEKEEKQQLLPFNLLIPLRPIRQFAGKNTKALDLIKKTETRFRIDYTSQTIIVQVLPKDSTNPIIFRNLLSYVTSDVLKSNFNKNSLQEGDPNLYTRGILRPIGISSEVRLYTWGSKTPIAQFELTLPSDIKTEKVISKADLKQELKSCLEELKPK